jgi:hypothetical protein
VGRVMTSEDHASMPVGERVFQGGAWPSAYANDKGSVEQRQSRGPASREPRVGSRLGLKPIPKSFRFKRA